MKKKTKQKSKIFHSLTIEIPQDVYVKSFEHKGNFLTLFFAQKVELQIECIRLSKSFN